MKVLYYIDPETGLAHICRGDVGDVEVQAVFGNPGEDRPGRGGARR